MVFSSLGDIISHSERFDAKDKDLIKNNGVVFTTKNICDSVHKSVVKKVNKTYLSKMFHGIGITIKKCVQQ